MVGIKSTLEEFENWRGFHSENASNVFRPHYARWFIFASCPHEMTACLQVSSRQPYCCSTSFPGSFSRGWERTLGARSRLSIVWDGERSEKERGFVSLPYLPQFLVRILGCAQTNWTPGWESQTRKFILSGKWLPFMQKCPKDHFSRDVIKTKESSVFILLRHNKKG